MQMWVDAETSTDIKYACQSIVAICQYLICLVKNHLDVLYFNYEELDWIADEHNGPEATERAINYIFLYQNGGYYGRFYFT